MTIHKLSEFEVKHAKKNVSDGGSLSLRVSKTGHKSWVFNYSRPITKKRNNIGLGGYPTVSLKKARGLAKKYRELISEGIDPKESIDNSLSELRTEATNSFKKVTDDWINVKKSQVSKDHAIDTYRSLEMHVFPILGDTPINKISAPMAIDCLKVLEAQDKFELIKRLSQRMNEVMIYATNYGLIQHNPLSGIKKTFKSPKSEHQKAITPDDLPKFMRTLNSSNMKIVTRLLIEWQLHTIARPREACRATWSEIDFEKKTWTISAKKMKMSRDHIVPLSTKALSILEKIKPISGHREYIFPANRNPNTHAIEATVNNQLRRIGYKGIMVAHGLRSLSSTILNTSLLYNKDIIEVALSHSEQDNVRKAYNRSIYLEPRREMMEWLSNHYEETHKIKTPD